MKKNVYVVRKNSKGGKPYVMMYVDCGYRNVSVTFDVPTIVELTGMSFEKVNTLDIDSPLQVGVLVSEKVGV